MYTLKIPLGGGYRNFPRPVNGSFQTVVLVCGGVVTFELPMLTFELPMLTFELPMLTFELPLIYLPMFTAEK